MTKIFLVALYLAGLNYACLAQERTNTPATQVDKLLAGGRTINTPGVVVMVFQDNKVVFAKGYGAANLEYNIPNKTNTIFDIASVSKQFTSFAIATLVHEGKISLDDDIRKYVPELHNFGHTITIRHLVMHVSGLRDQNDLLNLMGYRDGDIITNDAILELIFRQKALNFTPGQQFSYSNSGYTLLALVVERVTRTAFAEWTRQYIFSPLGMNNTFFITDYSTIIRNKAYSYAKDENGYRKIPFNSVNTGARGLQSTTEDLGKWVVNFSTKKVGSDSVLNNMNTAPVNNYRMKYNFGQAFTNYKGLHLVEHDGADAGYRTYIGRFPDQHLAVIVLGNLESINPRNTGLQIADIYLKKYLPRSSNEQTTPDAEKIHLPDEAEKRLEGQYQVTPDKLLTIWADDHVIRATVNQEAKEYYWRPLSTTTLESKELQATLTLKKGRIGEADSIIYKTGPSVATIPKTFVEDPASKKLLEFEGEYQSEELPVAYTIALKNNNLAVELPRGTVIRLKKQGTDVFSGSYYWFKKLQFIRNGNNEVTGFDVSAGRSLNIRFRKLPVKPV